MIDVAQELARLVADTGSVQDVMGAFRIRVRNASTFPWAAVLACLLDRDFKVDVTRHEADLVIQARP